MRRNDLAVSLGTLCLFFAMISRAQQTVSANGQPNSSVAQTAVPHVFKFSGVVLDTAGKPQTGQVAITFSLYEEEEGGSRLWSEIQNVTLDDQGRYDVLLGSTQPAGVPLDLFVSGKARWFGVRPEVAGLAEQPRVLLVGVPYALKAADADTLGGLPASSFIRANGVTEAVSGAKVNAAPNRRQEAIPASAPNSACAGLTSDGRGTAGRIAKFTGPCSIEPSLYISESKGQVSVTGNVGIGTKSPAGGLDVTTGTTQLFIGSSGNAGLMKLRRPSDGSANGYIGYGWTSQTADGPLAIVDANGRGEVRLDAYSTDGIVTAYTSNSERLRIDSLGNVGIGTSAPGDVLDVGGNTRVSAAGRIGFATTASQIGFNRNPTTGSIYNNSSNAYQLGQAGPNQPFSLSQWASTGAYLGTAFSVQPNNNVTLAQDGGNVGVGTTTPADLVDVAGSTRISGRGVSFATNNSGVGFNRNPANGVIYNPSSIAYELDQIPSDQHFSLSQWGSNGSFLSTPLEVLANGTVLLAQPGGSLGSGHVGIGTTTPAATLDVGGEIRAGRNTLGSYGLQLNYDATNDAGIIQARNFQNGVNRPLFLNANGGNVGVGTTTPTATLDVAGNIRCEGSGHGVIFPDGTIQTTSEVAGPAGPAGPPGPPGPPVHTSAVCTQPPARPPGCAHATVTSAPAPCTVTSDTGSCSALPPGTTGGGGCAVCYPN